MDIVASTSTLAPKRQRLGVGPNMGCGFSSPMGSWYHCSVRGVERRRAEDGWLYNSKEFRDHYRGKGKERYEASKPFVERRVGEDGRYYTSAEFRAFYVDAYGEEGWTDFWEAAGPEVRQDVDGYLRTFDDFSRSYGPRQALVNWQAAKLPTNITVGKGWLRRLWASAPKLGRIDAKPEIHGEWGEPVSTCACQGSKTKHGTCGFHFNMASAENQPW